MYSAILAAALLSGSDAAAFHGRQAGCHGAQAACTARAASCSSARVTVMVQASCHGSGRVGILTNFHQRAADRHQRRADRHANRGCSGAAAGCSAPAMEVPLPPPTIQKDKEKRPQSER
jgi:hypothetical protein